VRFDTLGADLRLGPSQVRQDSGVYHLDAQARGASGTVRLRLDVRPAPNRYFPPVDLREGERPSGYVVPALRARASGTICEGTRCRPVSNVPAYHDHNWGVWRHVTWDWGAARGHSFDLLYGAVHAPEDTLYAASGAPPIFVGLVDSLGVRQLLRAREIRYEGRHARAAAAGVAAPATFHFTAARDADTVIVRVTVQDFQASRFTLAGLNRNFLQMRGRFVLEGRVGGEPVRDEGTGFFETYVR
jgi:hypothetical protein